MLLGLAHAAVCVPDVEAAVAWYSEVLGLQVLSPPYLVEGDAISADMGELLGPPVALKGAIIGFDRSDHVIELVEYPLHRPVAARSDHAVDEVGITHLGLVCDDLDATLTHLEGAGVELLTSGPTSIAGLRTAWFRDPWGVTFILLEKGDAERPYWRQPR
ncbi:MAG TPA: VOC family protein [Acidimicrobiales bacterium]|nr:VOC family protein [Acidimicrobiales bacterium]